MTPTTENPTERQVVIVGGGPAGLTTALELTKHNARPIVFEKLDKVGGISRTENYKGFHFDMGGHRFYTKSQRVNDFWHDVLGDDFLKRPRMSRIYYNDTFFNYPLKPFNALAGLGLVESCLVIFSYLRWQLFPYKEEETFEQWVTNRFGKRLFEIFFKSYTEKVWGISTSELKAEWAAQRIKDLSLKSALVSMLLKNNNGITTLIEEFHYPRRGPGMLWTKVKEKVEERGGTVHLNSEVKGFIRNGNRIESVVVRCNGHEERVPATDVVSSMPIPDFIRGLNPPAPPEIVEAANKLKFRDFLTVCLVIDQEHLFPDNWIYVHYPEVKVGRIQNYKNWSPEMVPDLSKTSLGLEYFCNQGDEIWCMPDDDLIELGKREVARLGLAEYDDVIDGSVFRVENTYPVYDSDYAEHLGVVREYLESLENFQTIGRNGLHRYNNQDHAMLTGMLAVRNMLFNEKNDLWVVNAEQEYLEEVREEDTPPLEELVEETISEVFEKLDTGAFGIATGLASGLTLFLVTLLVVFFGLTPIAEKLLLIGEYLPGYSVTTIGSFVGLLGGFLGGFVVGWWFAFLRNALSLFSLRLLYRRAEFQLTRKLLEF